MKAIHPLIADDSPMIVKMIKKAPPATPVQILGLNGPPGAGESFIVTKNEKEARQLAQQHEQMQRTQKFNISKATSLQEIDRQLLGPQNEEKSKNSYCQ